VIGLGGRGQRTLSGLGVTVLAVVVFLAPGCGNQAQPPQPVNAKNTPASPSPPPIGHPAAASCPSAGHQVTDTRQLQQALKSASPGTVINIAPGTYSGHFVATASGTSAAPITLCGPREAVIDGGGKRSGYVLHLNGASWWKVAGFTVQDGQKGVVLDHANHVLISRLYVHDVGDEAVHLRSFSSDDTVEGNVIRGTGLLNAAFGEGVYIGSAHSNWCQYTACAPDASDRNLIKGNDISQTTAENVDIKEGTTGGVVEGNRLSGLGMVSSAATAWVNVKGNRWTIAGNVGEHSIGDGFAVHSVQAGWGENNVFRENHATVDGPGYGIYVQHSSLATRLTCDNTASGAASGLSNVGCTNG
jgi:hypothetical protein